MKKYTLLNDKKILRKDFRKDYTLHRIQALVDIPFLGVKKGDLGGFVESEENLSQEGECWIYPDAVVFGRARVQDKATVSGLASVRGHAIISGYATISDCAYISGHAQVKDDAHVRGNVTVLADSIIGGTAYVWGEAVFDENACIYNTRDYMVIGPIGSRDDFTTFYKTKNGDIWVSCGCFWGSIEEFRDQVKKTHRFNAYGPQYLNAADLAEKSILAPRP